MSVIDPRELAEALLEEAQDKGQKAQLEGVVASLTDDHPRVVKHKAMVKAVKEAEKSSRPATKAKKSTTGSKSSS